MTIHMNQKTLKAIQMIEVKIDGSDPNLLYFLWIREVLETWHIFFSFSPTLELKLFMRWTRVFFVCFDGKALELVQPITAFDTDEKK